MMIKKIEIKKNSQERKKEVRKPYLTWNCPQN
jgi:hypothetical protein